MDTNPILLSGFLDKKHLQDAKMEMTQSSRFMLVLDSTGGDMGATIDFIKSPHLEHLAGVKIYQAESAAAFIALALKTKQIVMKTSATLKIHLGALILEASDVSGDRINEKTASLLHLSQKELETALLYHGLLQDKKAMAELYSSNWLNLSAAECLERGIVSSLF